MLAFFNHGAQAFLRPFRECGVVGDFIEDQDVRAHGRADGRGRRKGMSTLELIGSKAVMCWFTTLGTFRQATPPLHDQSPSPFESAA